MKNFYLIFFTLISLFLTACSTTPKAEFESNLREFSNDKVSLKIEVILPQSYTPNNANRYPVIYLLDGYWNKDFFATLYHGLRFDNMIPEVIVVNIDYPEAVTNYEEQRMWDLTPAYDNGFKAGGNGNKLLALLSNDVVPFIDKNYKIDPQRTVLLGHSLAGLFTLYSMYEQPSLFSHYAAISPSALWSNHHLSQIDRQFHQHHQHLKAKAYITYGTDEYSPYVESLENYIKQLKGRNYSDLDLKQEKVLDMRHVSMKAEGYTRAILWVFSDSKPEGPSEFEKKNLQALEQE